MGKRVLFSLFDYIGGIITIILSFICCFSFLSKFIHPSQIITFQWISLFLPVLLILNGGILIFWLIRRKKWFWFPLIALISNFWFYPSVINWSFSSGDRESSLEKINIVTYNIHAFRYDKSAQGVSTFIKHKNVDILCLQEIPADMTEDKLSEIFPFLPYVAITKSSDNSIRTSILSRYPIINTNTISFTERVNCALAVDMEIGGRTISVINCHLQTTNWNQRSLIVAKENPIDRGYLFPNIQRKVMEQNFAFRAQQADSLKRLIEKNAHPVIVCCDMNDTPASYVYHNMKGQLTDSFHSAGYGYTYTYRYMCNLLRIDYIFYSSDHFNGILHESPDINYSDHNPVIATLSLTD